MERFRSGTSKTKLSSKAFIRFCENTLSGDATDSEGDSLAKQFKNEVGRLEQLYQYDSWYGWPADLDPASSRRVKGARAYANANANAARKPLTESQSKRRRHRLSLQGARTGAFAPGESVISLVRTNRSHGTNGTNGTKGRVTSRWQQGIIRHVLRDGTYYDIDLDES